MSKIGIGIIGCGLIGQKRSAAIEKGQVKAVCDLDSKKATFLSEKIHCRVAENPSQLLESNDIQLVVVATNNVSLAPLTLEAVKKGKHVLVEKPGACQSSQLKEIQSAAEKTGAQVKVGYNHRYHPAFLKAREIVDTGDLGRMMFVRARYGHGGRVGYDKEWRADPALSGGGELIDQGVHLIDLAKWFLGKFDHVYGDARTYYWNMPVDDNAFMHLRTSEGQNAWLHVSCTEWKNTFSFEVYGELGKLHIEGLGGSYGMERLAYYQMKPEMGPPETTVYEFPRGDDSWGMELRDFIATLTSPSKKGPSHDLHALKDAIETLETVEKIYSMSGYSFQEVKGRVP